MSTRWIEGLIMPHADIPRHDARYVQGRHIATAETILLISSTFWSCSNNPQLEIGLPTEKPSWRIAIS